MTPERWRRIERRYHAALELPPHDRDIFLRTECAADDCLRQELESLLREGDGRLLSGRALDVAARQFAQESEPDLTGRTHGRYEVLSRLGSGAWEWSIALAIPG